MHRNNVHLLHPISYLEYSWCEFFGIFLVFGGVKRKINFHNKIFASTVDYLALESQLPHCFSNVVSIILTSSESAIVQLVHDVARRHGFRAANAVGLSEECADGLCAIIRFLESPVVVGDELALLMGWLWVEAVVEQVQCLCIGTFVGQRKVFQIHGALEVDDQIAAGALCVTDEVVFVGGGDERGTAFPQFTEAGIGVADIRTAGGDNVLEGFAFLVAAKGDFIEEDERCLGERDDEVLVNAFRGTDLQSVVAKFGRQDMTHEVGLADVLQPLEDRHLRVLADASQHQCHHAYVPFLQHQVVEVLIHRVIELQVAYVEVAQIVGVGVRIPRLQTVEPRAEGIVVLAEVAAEDERLDILAADIQPLFLQTTVVGVEVAVLNGSPRLSLFADLRALAPCVVTPLGLPGGQLRRQGQKFICR